MPSTIPSEDAWIRARDRYIEDLDEEETIIYRNANPEAILYDASAAEKRHSFRSSSRHMMEKLQPLITSIEAFGLAFDVYSNTFSLALSPLWGSIRIVLHVAREFGKFFVKIVEMFARIGDALPQLRDYVKIFPHRERLKHAVSLIYVDVLHFCFHAKHLFRCRRNPLITNFKVGIQLPWKPFAWKFEEQMSTFSEHRKSVEKEAEISHLIEAADARAMIVANQKELEKQKRVDERLRLLAALSVVDGEAKHQRVRRKRHPGTGEWLFKDPKYMQWRSDSAHSSTLLCCHGIPGSGKTVLASTIIEDLLHNPYRESSQVIYSYCDYADHNTLLPVNIFNAWLKQLYVKKQIPKDIEEQMLQLYVKEMRTPEEEEVCTILISVISLSAGLHIILDGLDECEREGLMTILNFLSRLEKLETPALKVVVFCRNEDRAVQSLSHYNQIHISPAALAGDIDAFVGDSVAMRLRSGTLKISNPSLERDLVSELTVKAKGMFLWVSFQLDELCEVASDDEIRKVLKDLPEGLSTTYERILWRISHNAHNTDLACKVFKWLACVRRPLSIEELREAVAFKPFQYSWNINQIPDGDLMMRSCRGLVVREDDATQAVHFAHHTVQQYLLFGAQSSNNHKEAERFWFSRHEADTLVGRLCITYLSFSDFEMQVTRPYRNHGLQPDILLKANALSGVPSTLGISQNLFNLTYRALGGNPTRHQSDFAHTTYSQRPKKSSEEVASSLADKHRFLGYVIKNWEYHTRQFSPEDSDSNAMLQYLAKHASLAFEFRPWGANRHFGHYGCKTCNISAVSQEQVRNLPYMALMHYAAEVGNLALMQPLIQVYCSHEMAQPETLLIACHHGHLDVISRLMRDVDFDLYDGKALDLAARYGHASVLRQLLSKASKDLVDIHGPMLLDSAIRRGHGDVTEVLCEEGALKVQQLSKLLPLHVAASKGHEAVAKTLIKFGASVNTLCDGKTALHLAAENGHTAVVALLLDYGHSDVNAEVFANGPCLAQTAMHLAAMKGHARVIWQLAQAGGCLTTQDAIGLSPLHCAVAGRHQAVVRVVLELYPDSYVDFIRARKSITEEDVRRAIQIVSKEVNYFRTSSKDINRMKGNNNEIDRGKDIMENEEGKDTYRYRTTWRRIFTRNEIREPIEYPSFGIPEFRNTRVSEYPS